MTTFQKGRGGKWYYRFQLNGTEYYRACKGATNKKEANQYEAIVKAELMKGNLGILENKKKATLKEAVTLYLEYSQNNKKSYLNDNAYTQAFLNFFSNAALLDILPTNIEDFKNYLATSGKKQATINRYLQAFSKLFNIAISNKLIKENPMKTVKKLKEENHKIRFLTKNEEIYLFEALPDHLINIVDCALKTGMRKTEILKLKWENVDFDFNFIELLFTKSGKKRKIPLSPKLRKLLEVIRKDNNSEYVFINKKTGEPYSDIKKAFNSAVKNSGLQNFRFHDLRHTFATRLIEKGVDIVVVKELLGHADIKTTMIYVHSDSHRKQNAVNILDDY